MFKINPNLFAYPGLGNCAFPQAVPCIRPLTPLAKNEAPVQRQGCKCGGKCKKTVEQQAVCACQKRVI